MLRAFASVCARHAEHAAVLAWQARHQAPSPMQVAAPQWRGYAALRQIMSRTPLSSPAAKGAADKLQGVQTIKQFCQRRSFSIAGATKGQLLFTHGLKDPVRHHIAAWLGVCSGWVFSLIVLGGVTRLTRSGLSMTDWKFTGEKPPLCQSDWEQEYEKYKRSPEFRKVNPRMSLEDFKFIYWMEYAHRMWGRALGVVFAAPALYFAAKGQLTRPLVSRLLLLFAMGGTQGFIGWWMVRSGLQQPVDDHTTPRVSPYRLATHLVAAFSIYATMVWTTLTLVYPESPTMLAFGPQASGARLLRGRAAMFAGLVSLTAATGAFVAGNDAGRAYNTFPLMNGEIIPQEYFSVQGWRNAFESTAAVQLHHRALALTTLAAAGGLWWTSRGLSLPPACRTMVTAVAHMSALQVVLGVATLLTYVPPALGSLHQAGALVLFTLTLGLLHTTRLQPRLAPRMAAIITPASLALIAGLSGLAINTN